VSVDGETILTGRVEAVAPTVSAADRIINVQGRSLTGALIDCSIEGVGYQFQGLSLLAIAQKLCGPFGVDVVSVAGSGPEFKTARGAGTIAEAVEALKDSRAEPGQTVFGFLNSIAVDAGLLLTCDVKGRLVMTKITPASVPVASLVEGAGGVMEVSGTYDGTARFSRYKVLQQQDGANAIAGTADDGGVPIYRPKVEVGSSVNAVSVSNTATWQRALALAGSVGVTVQMSGWRTPAGQLWTPGQVVTLKAPGAFIMRDTAFVVAEATLTLDTSDGRTTGLRLVLPSTYSGILPGGYPWD
jgi:prophage tail gpP-like protein